MTYQPVDVKNDGLIIRGGLAVDAITLNGSSVSTTVHAGATGPTGPTGPAASYSVTTGVTATGTTRTNAATLTSSIVVISTATAGTGVVLPSAASVGTGNVVTIFNDGAAAVKVYAAGSDTIDGTAGSTGVTLTNAKRCQYFCTSSSTFKSAQLGVASA